ncbi:G2/mitotic-specific cyclin S13-7 [Neltuma alba]|uniref:G2/mitotic-specific cyclin S13-7 n=1 Tax=Neltuma alba TaxID=207710 RepID=UPI0010A3D8C5|nr:G2/mitotic-specific cyclin S13-7-like [Prosopis alba]
MATGACLPHELQRGENKPKNVAVEGRSRRVLQDIGNLVDVSKRITRQEAEKNKKPSLATTKVLAAGKIVRPEGPEVITISSDEEDSEEVKKEKKKKEPAKVINSKQNSTKKNVKTLSAILSARSKAACGRTYKPKDQVLDVDASDVDNELAAVEYIDELYKFYKFAESDSRVYDYMGSQPDVNAKMRAILVDWLIEVHRKFELMPETLHLTINIVDRFLSLKAVSRKELQLVGISSMLIACKYEEIWSPEVNDFVCISDNAYKREQVLVMEKTILRKLEWYLTVPTPYVFLVRYIKVSSPSDKEMENMAYFLAELGLVHYATVILYSPSVIAASAVYAARFTLGRSPFWTQTLEHYTGLSEDKLRECAKLMVSFHSLAGESKLKAVFKKFCNPDRCSVALIPPGKLLLVENVR